MQNIAYQRIILKLSGEALKGNANYGVDSQATAALAAQIGEIAAMGVELALVIGAGNIFRGLAGSKQGMSRVTGDRMGMMATIINALAMQDALEQAGVPVQVQTAFPIPGVGEPFDQRRALKHLAAGTVVIFAGGTGHPFFTTDTTAALRACEINAAAIFKATKVDGVYSADPKTNPEATRYSKLAYTDALNQRLQIMDASAFSLCMDNDIPIVVFNFSQTDALKRVIAGNHQIATVVSHETTSEG
jgi:uridylate kinase